MGIGTALIKMFGQSDFQRKKNVSAQTAVCANAGYFLVENNESVVIIHDAWVSYHVLKHYQLLDMHHITQTWKGQYLMTFCSYGKLILPELSFGPQSFFSKMRRADKR